MSSPAHRSTASHALRFSASISGIVSLSAARTYPGDGQVRARCFEYRPGCMTTNARAWSRSPSRPEAQVRDFRVAAITRRIDVHGAVWTLAAHPGGRAGDD